MAPTWGASHLTRKWRFDRDEIRVMLNQGNTDYCVARRNHRLMRQRHRTARPHSFLSQPIFLHSSGKSLKGATAAISLTNSVRDFMPSLSIKLARWVSMVRTLSLNSSAIILLVFPVMMRSATLRSAGVSCANWRSANVLFLPPLPSFNV